MSGLDSTEGVFMSEDLNLVLRTRLCRKWLCRWRWRQYADAAMGYPAVLVFVTEDIGTGKALFKSFGRDRPNASCVNSAARHRLLIPENAVLLADPGIHPDTLEAVAHSEVGGPRRYTKY